MGMFAPEEGETHRFVLELKGRKNLTQGQYKAYKLAIAKAVEKYGAKIAEGEYVFIKKETKKKGRK